MLLALNGIHRTALRKLLILVGQLLELVELEVVHMLVALGAHSHVLLGGRGSLDHIARYLVCGSCARTLLLNKIILWTESAQSN